MGPDLAFAAAAEGRSLMGSVELSARGDGPVVVTLRGELDVSDAASVSAALAAIASSGCNLILDLEGLEFIDSSGLAAFARARRHARQAGFDVLLAAPRPQVLRMLALTRMSDVFPVHLCVEDAAGTTGRTQVAIVSTARSSVLRAAS
jgi:anti-sigma B factor antagonist